MVYPALLPLIRTPRLPAVDWTDVIRRFKWTRPFCRKMKSGFCACAITFQPFSITTCSLFVAQSPFYMYVECTAGPTMYSSAHCNIYLLNTRRQLTAVSRWWSLKTLQATGSPFQVHFLATTPAIWHDNLQMNGARYTGHYTASFGEPFWTFRKHIICVFNGQEVHKSVLYGCVWLKYRVISRLTKIIRSGITFVSRNVIFHRFL